MLRIRCYCRGSALLCRNCPSPAPTVRRPTNKFDTTRPRPRILRRARRTCEYRLLYFLRRLFRIYRRRAGSPEFSEPVGKRSGASSRHVACCCPNLFTRPPRAVVPVNHGKRCRTLDTELAQASRSSLRRLQYDAVFSCLNRINPINYRRPPPMRRPSSHSFPLANRRTQRTTSLHR